MTLFCHAVWSFDLTMPSQRVIPFSQHDHIREEKPLPTHLPVSLSQQEQKALAQYEESHLMAILPF
jgi:hypothetical protein